MARPPASPMTRIDGVTELSLGLSLSGSHSPSDMVQAAVAAERFGFDSVWTSEAWGNDAFTPLGAIAAVTQRIRLGTAIAQISARSPGATAMTVLTLQELSGGRIDLGLGVSGPQVVEGWHGASFARPLVATREYVTILRAMLAADRPVEIAGSIYSVPYRGQDATGLGKPLRSSLPARPETPILIAAIGPRNVELATKVADGLLPYLWSPTRWQEAWGETLAAAQSGFVVAPTVFVSMGDDLDACRDALRPRIALHIGGMGSRNQNFYKDLIVRYGYEEEATKIQDLFLSGDRKAARAAVTDDLVDDLALVGSVERITDQLEAWREGPVTTMILEPTNLDDLEAISKLWGR
jgi:F420-dependent oxidoreductase-like protein